MPKAKQKPSNGASNTPALRSSRPPPNYALRPQPERDAFGRWEKGSSGQGTADAARARKALNLATIQEMHEAFRRGGRQAIDKVMKNAPAQFLKMLVLLVPRELEVTHSGGVKGMSDEQLERGIEALEALMAKRVAGADAKVIEAQAIEPGADQPSATES